MNKTHTPNPGKTIARQFTVYLPTDLNQWLRQSAKRNGRTLTKQTEMVIRLGKRMVSRQVKSTTP